MAGTGKTDTQRSRKVLSAEPDLEVAEDEDVEIVAAVVVAIA